MISSLNNILPARLQDGSRKDRPHTPGLRQLLPGNSDRTRGLRQPGPADKTPGHGFAALFC